MYLGCRNPQRGDAFCRQPFVSHCVSVRPRLEVVGHAVHLDCQCGRAAEEVQHEWTERMLAAEL